MTSRSVLVVGAGLSGLACAVHLRARGLDVQVVEASDGAGGRVRTDVVGGFRLDRGFQVLLSAYPEARARFDYGALDLRPFKPGALVRKNRGFHRVADPRRLPMVALRSLPNPVGTLGDKLKVRQLVARATAGDFASLFQGVESTTLDALLGLGFSPSMLDTFFRPFLGGIQLDRSLSTSSYLLDFVIRMMVEGDTCVPALGMGTLADQLAARVGAERIHLGRRVQAVDATGVILEGGERMAADAVVVAVEGPEAHRLLGTEGMDRGSRGVTCLYFVAPQSPVEGAWLVLNGEGETDTPVNNLAVMSEVSSAYAPAGQHLISATVLGIPEGSDAVLEEAVRRQLRGWFGGAAVASWSHLRTYRIPHAQPEQAPGFRDGVAGPKLADHLFACGDYQTSGSIQGALAAGRAAAEAV